MRWYWLMICWAGWVGMVPTGQAAAQNGAIRIGYFPNVTHAQALYARATGAFAKTMRQPIQWTAFNAGPTAIEALFADEIDATYAGPGPAIIGYIRSHGEKFVIVSGAAIGGAALVVRPGSGIVTAGDFGGKTIATPQLGNTQDITARIWLRDHGYRSTAQGGTVNIVALSNPDQLTLFREKQIDGAWTVEPWVSRLALEGGGKIFLDESSLWPDGRYATTLLLVSRSFLLRHPDAALNLVRAHVAVTKLLRSNASPALLNGQIAKETGRALRNDVITMALKHVQFTWDPVYPSVEKYARWAAQINFLREKPDLRGFLDLRILNRVLAEDNLPPAGN